MSTNIDAETARLAGLQIDLNSKLRSGNLTLDQFEWWLNQTKYKRHTLMSGEEVVNQLSAPEPVEKFALLVDLGIIVVPGDYDHSTSLAKFKERHQGGKKKSFHYYNDEITDKNFPNPTRILKSGDKLRVRAFKQVVGGTTTSEERMAFLATQKAIHTGAQGASLVFDQKRDQLPKGKWYASFDEKDRLWADAGGRHRVPNVICYSGGDFRFRLGGFEGDWHGNDAFLCFCDVD